MHARCFLAISCLFGLCFTLTACSSDSGEDPSGDAGVDVDAGVRSASDVSAPVYDMGADVGEDLTDVAPRDPRVGAVTYIREFGGCAQPSCMTELLFSVDGSMMSRIQMGSVTDRKVLTDEEMEQLRGIVGDDIFIGRVQDGFSCEPYDPEQTDLLVRIKTIVIGSTGERDTYLNDVTGCYLGDGAPRADAFLDFARLMHQRHYGEF